MTDEMIPPHNEQAEQAVIGSVLKSPSVLAELSGVLLAEDFYTPRNRALYGAALALG
jgi:replicative DNA helicase